MKPGCFGSHVCFAQDHVVCMSCPLKTQCGPLAKESLRAVRQKHGIDASVKRAPESELIAIRNGRNPYNKTKHPALYVLTRTLLSEGSFSPKVGIELSARLMNGDRQRAEGEVGDFCRMLIGGGVAKIKNSRLEVAR